MATQDPGELANGCTLSERVDAHHHLWRYTPEEFGWLGDEMAVLRRDFHVRDLEQALISAGVSRAVAVQARCSVAETEFLLDCGRQTSYIAGVVGWVELTGPALAACLERFAADRLFRGVREIAQGQPAGFLERPEFDHGIAQLTVQDLTYDLLIYADQLPEATRLADRHPLQRLVLDHAAKPRIAEGLLEPWRTDLRELARRPNVMCKLSGLVTEAEWDNWSLETLRPYLDACVESFGPERLLAGSDWPVCLVATGYAEWWQTLATYLADFSASEQQAILADNACTAYRLPVQTQAQRDLL